ncbi:hypothetical protein FGG08_006742 [Glutinoglossum americanum]|uniref:Heterokaryon incompatibility domain-containing protein n=1 Tax=Glutinoglossum americanum TaxID=1670608 RepID=A0A9P8HVP8_9PEZI|nr:hypothetical protein FGG08_006742 [Glutinoglossum americanum]
MTSYEWQPGHKYGPYIGPQYNALSYTWGRYRLTTEEIQQMPQVIAIGISGITWEVPRIHPNHFTAAEFQAAIQRAIHPIATGIQMLASMDQMQDSPSVDFLWLDIACVDQSPNSATGAAEIGRQAMIFQGADAVFVWLVGHTEVQLSSCLASLFRDADIAQKNHTTRPAHEAGQRWSGSTTDPGDTSKSNLHGDEPWLNDAITQLDLLLSDGWFSSLWTLQEAFLCSQAILISRDAETVDIFTKTLDGLFRACNILHTVCLRSIRLKLGGGCTAHPAEESLIQKSTNSGLAALAMRNPMSLYTVARYRQTTFPLDRIYGIMQVFDLRLGKAAPGAVQTDPWDLPQLQLQLGIALLEKDPTMSQLHIHATRPPVGQAWRVSDSSIVPDLVNRIPMFGTSTIFGEYRTNCHLSTKTYRSQTWGYFGGMICPLEVLQSAWKAAEQQPEYAAPLSRGIGSIQQIALDATEFILPGELSEDPPFNVPIKNGRHHQFGDQVVKMVKSQSLEVSVLYLGQFYDERRDKMDLSNRHGRFVGDKVNIGILLVRKDDVWIRQGLCIWDISPLDSRSPVWATLTCQSLDWQNQQGLFG